MPFFLGDTVWGAELAVQRQDRRSARSLPRIQIGVPTLEGDRMMLTRPLAPFRLRPLETAALSKRSAASRPLRSNDPRPPVRGRRIVLRQAARHEPVKLRVLKNANGLSPS
jgi:hypothetical protein